MEQRKYGLFTAIAMIVGIVIGSGIFFKSANVLVYTRGNVLLGVFVFTVAALGIIFGSLTIAQLASRTDKPGGVITYAEEFCNRSVGCAFGWFYTFLYYPTLVAVVAWVAGIYSCLLFGLPMTLEMQVGIGTIVMVVLFVVNILSAKLGGLFQNAAMVIKLIPLFIIAIVGLAIGNPAPILAKDMGTVFSSAGWITAIVPIAFSFDGWIVSTSIGHEIRNSKRNLPIALVISPILILAVYIAYFVGISALVGPDKVMEMGNSHVDYAAQMLFGPWGAKVIVVFVLISVMGTVNGVTLALIRMPYSLAVRNMLPCSKTLSRQDKKLGIPVPSAVMAFVISAVWMAIHYVTQKLSLMPNADVSEISIVFNYMGYIILYVAVISLAHKGEVKSLWKGYIFPILAICGSLVILVGGVANPLFTLYFVICSIVVGTSLLYYRANKEKII